MIKYILKRVAILLVTLWVVITLSFFLMQILPGTPYNNPKLTEEMIALLNKQYGLDKPVWQQYLTYLWNVLHGDFGTSYQSVNQPVSRMIRSFSTSRCSGSRIWCFRRYFGRSYFGTS